MNTLILIITVYRRRGRAAGVRKQQDRFMRFLYQLFAAPYHWGNSGGRYQRGPLKEKNYNRR